MGALNAAVLLDDRKKLFFLFLRSAEFDRSQFLLHGLKLPPVCLNKRRSAPLARAGAYKEAHFVYFTYLLYIMFLQIATLLSNFLQRISPHMTKK